MFQITKCNGNERSSGTVDHDARHAAGGRQDDKDFNHEAQPPRRNDRQKWSKASLREIRRTNAILLRSLRPEEYAARFESPIDEVDLPIEEVGRDCPKLLLPKQGPQ